MAHTTQAIAAADRWRAAQSRAAQEGMASAVKSATTPKARNGQPAMSVPCVLANNPFLMMPKIARPMAATESATEATDRRDGVMVFVTGVTRAGGRAGLLRSCLARFGKGRGQSRCMLRAWG